MADSFDPYQEWLGISPFEPPPNHYRLLGLRPFEDSVDVIQQTVIRLTARIKGLAADQPESVTRRVLADLATARDCLVNPETRAAYDRTLREQMPSLSTIAARSAVAMPSNPASTGAARDAVPADDNGETVIFQAADIAGEAAGASNIGNSLSASGSSPSATNAGTSGVNLSAAASPSGKTKAKLIGEYVIIERIGVGGMGQVFKAQHRKLKRIVAIKVLPPQSIKSVDSVRRFYREVESAAKLTHPNIVAAFDAGEQNGIHYLVMEFVDGRDLSQILKQEGTLPVDKAVDYIRQAATGLAYAHREGIVHRDIKPANLLLDKEGRVKILDMGLASNDQSITLAEGAAKGMTSTGQIMGTVDYMSPEQAEDTHQADARSDIYSLGCTLYRLLTNDLPYKGDTLMKKIMAHRSAPLPALRDARKDVPAALDEVFQRMVAKSPADRFQSMDELSEALKTCLRPRPAPPPRAQTTPPRAQANPSPKAGGAPPASPAKARPAGRNRETPEFLMSGALLDSVPSESGEVYLSAFAPAAEAANIQRPSAPNRRSAGSGMYPVRGPKRRNWLVVAMIAGGMIAVSGLLVYILKLLHG